LNDDIRQAFEATNNKVILASSTIELIKIPELKVDINPDKKNSALPNFN
jgi:hypothetical protein